MQRRQQVQTVTNPAPNAEWIFNIPAGRRWIIKSIIYNMNSTGANAYTKLRVFSDAGVTLIKEFSTAINPGVAGVNVCCYHVGELQNVGNPSGVLALNIEKDMIVEGGWRIDTSSNNIANITYTLIKITYEEIL